MRQYTWLTTVLVAVVIMLVVMSYYDHYFADNVVTPSVMPRPQVQQPATVIQADHYVHALIVDMNVDSNPSLLDLYSGEDALLAVHKNMDPLRHDDDILYDVPVLLAMFDQNHDGRIDAHDSIFSQLELIFYNKPHGNWQYVPVTQAGIRAIYVDPKYYNKVGLQLPVGRSVYPAGTVIMADSTARLMRDVMLDGDYLRKQILGQ